MSETGAERLEPDHPRIYVASLIDYNAGRLHGAWLVADADIERLQAGVQAMLAASPEPLAEEYAIHDYEGFGDVHLSEYEDLGRVAVIGSGIATYGEAFAAWVSVLDGGEAVSVQRFEEAFRGTWASLTAYADDLLADLGAESYLTAIPDWLQPYVELRNEAFARDIVLGGDIAAIEGTAGVHIFDRDV